MLVLKKSKCVLAMARPIRLVPTAPLETLCLMQLPTNRQPAYWQACWTCLGLPITSIASWYWWHKILRPNFTCTSLFGLDFCCWSGWSSEVVDYEDPTVTFTAAFW